MLNNCIIMSFNLNSEKNKKEKIINIRIQWLLPIIVIISLVLVGCAPSKETPVVPEEEAPTPVVIVVTVEVPAAPAEVAAPAVEESPAEVERPDIGLEDVSEEGSVIYVGSEDPAYGLYPEGAEVKLYLLAVDALGLHGPGLVVDPNAFEGEEVDPASVNPERPVGVILEGVGWNMDNGLIFSELPLGYYWQAEDGFTSKPNGEAKWVGPEEEGIAFLYDPDGEQIAHVELSVEFLEDPVQVAIATGVAATQTAQSSDSDTLAAQATNTPAPEAPAPVEVPPTATPIPPPPAAPTPTATLLPPPPAIPTATLLPPPPAIPTAAPIVQTSGVETKVIYHDGDFQNGVGTYPSNILPWLDLLVKLNGVWYGPEREPGDGINAVPLPGGLHWEATGGFAANPNGEAWWDGPEFVGVGLLYNVTTGLTIEVPLEVGFFSVGGSDDEKCDDHDSSCNGSGSGHPTATPFH